MEKSNRFIDDRKIIDKLLVQLYEEEFNEIYEFINSDLKSTNEFKGLYFETNVLGIRNKYLLKKTELLKNRKPLI